MCIKRKESELTWAKRWVVKLQNAVFRMLISMNFITCWKKILAIPKSAAGNRNYFSLKLIFYDFCSKVVSLECSFLLLLVGDIINTGNIHVKKASSERNDNRMDFFII